MKIKTKYLTGIILILFGIILFTTYQISAPYCAKNPCCITSSTDTWWFFLELGGILFIAIGCVVFIFDW